MWFVQAQCQARFFHTPSSHENKNKIRFRYAFLGGPPPLCRIDERSAPPYIAARAFPRWCVVWCFLIIWQVQGRFFRLDLKNEMVVMENSPIMMKTAVDLRPKERNLDLHAACLVNSFQGMDDGVLFRLNCSIHQHTSIGCGTSFLHMCSRSLSFGQRVDGWIV